MKCPCTFEDMAGSMQGSTRYPPPPPPQPHQPHLLWNPPTTHLHSPGPAPTIANPVRRISPRIIVGVIPTQMNIHPLWRPTQKVMNLLPNLRPILRAYKTSFLLRTPLNNRHWWLLEFFKYLNFTDCGRKKSRNKQQHASQVRTILEELEPRGRDIQVLSQDEGCMV